MGIAVRCRLPKQVDSVWLPETFLHLSFLQNHSCTHGRVGVPDWLTTMSAEDSVAETLISGSAVHVAGPV